MGVNGSRFSRITVFGEFPFTESLYHSLVVKVLSLKPVDINRLLSPCQYLFGFSFRRLCSSPTRSPAPSAVHLPISPASASAGFSTLLTRGVLEGYSLPHSFHLSRLANRFYSTPLLCRRPMATHRGATHQACQVQLHAWINGYLPIATSG